MHLDLANLACTFVFQTASFHVTHLHEVVRAHRLHALVTRPKTPPLFCWIFIQRAWPSWIIEWQGYRRLLGWFYSLIFSLLMVSSDLTPAESHVWNILKLDPEGNMPRFPMLISWLVFILIRVCELVIPLMNKGAPRSALYKMHHNSPELSTGSGTRPTTLQTWNLEVNGWKPIIIMLLPRWTLLTLSLTLSQYIVTVGQPECCWYVSRDGRDGDALTSFRKLIPSWCMMLSMYSNAFGCVVHVFFRKIDGTVLSRLLISFLWGAFFPMPYFTVPSDPISMKYESGHVWGHWSSS